MEARPSHIQDEHDPTVQIRVQVIGELQDTVSRNLAIFYKTAYRYVGNPHDAEDAVQDALLSAYKHLDQFKGTAKMTTWLTSIVTNSALTQLRRRVRRPHVSLDEPVAAEQSDCVADRVMDMRPTPERVYIQSELHDHLMRSVMELSPSLRKAIQLCDLGGLKTMEAAEILGVAQGTVKAQVSRGRAKLKQRMCEE
ncbi:MAG TPA: RNA polymerase sigma factor [Terracidiphilus sp.]|jgi:RNA polymerase sigma-70 factor (ECF subfamily)